VKSVRDVIIRPVVSEKSYEELEANRYTFLVAPDSNKTQIKQAIESIWNVRVLKVNTMNRKGKTKQGGRYRSVMGQRANQKRAIVTLAQGDQIEIFESGK
jgi:large subunit ribosomal protein L23